MNDINKNDLETEIDLIELFNVIWNGKFIILSITLFFSIGIVLYSLSLPNIYQSKAVLSPVEESAQNQTLKNYSGLASFAGISLPSGARNVDKALKKITSLSFYQSNILPNIFLPDLMALESWDDETNTIAYNKDIYDQESQAWIREYVYPMSQIPSAQESFEVFRNILKVSQDKDTGFITISISHQSPYLAKIWVEIVVNEINNYFRYKDKEEAMAAKDYLNKQIAEANLSEIKQVIAQLIQEKTKQLTLIEVKEFYVFDYIDPPVVMELKSEPNRAFMCILVSLIGGFFGVIVVLFRFYFKKQV